LLLAILLHRSGHARVTVRERNAPDDTFGFGVVFSDETLANLRSADPELFDRIEVEFAYWPIMDVVHRGHVLRSGGHGFAALARKRLLNILAERAVEVGVDVQHLHEVGDVAGIADCDLIVGCDGVNSMVRAALADQFGPTIDRGAAKYIWFGTPKRLPHFTFFFVETEWGLFQAHAYPFSADASTFIIETDRATWQRAGLDPGTRLFAAGETDMHALAFCEEVFAKELDGASLVGNNSRWIEFATVRNTSWRAMIADHPVVLLGDAAHTAHFSIGSGTKLAFEDAIALHAALTDSDAPLADRLHRYEADRRPKVESTQRAAVTSQRWFEAASRYIDLPPEQFAFQLLTRSQRITYDNLVVRDPAFGEQVLGEFRNRVTAELRPTDPTTPPMFYPLRLRGLTLANRIVVSPMAQYCAVDGVPNDWHLVHLGSRAVGGAGLVLTEMTCVAPEGRITPGCTGIWNDEQTAAWSRVTSFVHEHTGSAIGLQIGHSGRKGSTRVAWMGMDQPLQSSNWDLIAPSAIAYTPRNATPRAMTRDDMDAVVAQHVTATRNGIAAGFDLLEVHAAHGYLLSSFLSPVTNHRDDTYGGSLENRMRFPLEVIAAVRAEWPADRPLSVRISATDWVGDGFDGDDAVILASRLHDIGCDIIDVSTGQVDPTGRPEFGRLYQTPFADRIRQEAHVPTMTVGAVSSVDDVNTIILAGRADLCLLARPHLVDPYWTLNAAIDQGVAAHPWPRQYLSGQTARRREQQALSHNDRIQGA
jgi:anthraniloyl-CoA monooxygenase